MAEKVKIWDFSRGHKTLDLALPNPTPEHTYNELPIIKETV